jgi:PKD repeat protein
MKKIILYQLKSIQENCLAFSCNDNAGFLSLFWTNKFIKNLFFCASLFLFSQGSLYAQKISGAAVQANFGIDADVYANHEQFTLPPVPSSNVDDWFLKISGDPSWSGDGLNVILQDSVTYFKDRILANSNTAFERRMSVAKGTTVGSYLWLDAVYGRDGNSSQGNKDVTVFTKTTDKNSQNPTTWNLGTGGSPQKNDIVDVVAHLRGKGPKDPSPSDPRPFTELWAYGGATTMSADGNAHNDFEFFRNDVTFANGMLINPGSDEGHTAWVFDGTGNPSTPGDILISVDFENGGTNPLGSVRVWMKKSDVVVGTFNAKGDRPFDITGVFDGTSGALYGYAEIAKKGSYPSDAVNTDIFAVVNVAADTFGAPWGSLEGPKAQYLDDIEKLQFSEFGINLTAFGLDKKTAQSTACASLLGTLLVKTRSSSSFTAELKDFAGPYPFGNAVQPAVNLAVNREINCINTTATITASNVVPSGSTVKFYGPPSAANGGLGPEIIKGASDSPLTRLLTPGANIPGTNGTYQYTVVVSADGFLGCEAKKTVDVKVNKVAPIADFTTSPVCLGTASSFTNTSTGASLSYSWDFGDSSTKSTDQSPTHTYASTGTFNVTLTVTSGAGGTGCTASISHNAVVNLIPGSPSVTYNPPACDEPTFSITVNGLIKDAIYTVTDKDGIEHTDSPYTATGAETDNKRDFGGFAAGVGYKVTVSQNDCVSLPETCGTPTPPPTITKTAEVAAPIEAKTTNSGFDAYPVPFKDQLTIKYNFDYQSDVKIEVFNSRGNLVHTKKDTNSYLGKEITLDLHANKGQEQVFIVKLTTDRESSTKKVMSSE